MNQRSQPGSSEAMRFVIEETSWGQQIAVGQRGRDLTHRYSQTFDHWQSQLRQGRASLADVDLQKNQTYLNKVCEMPGSGSIRPLMIQVAENQWQMRYRDVLFEFERNENSIIYVSKSDSSGKKVIAHLLADNPLDDYEFDPLNEEWVRRSQ